MQETWAPSLGWEDALEKGRVTLSSILPWKIPWTIQASPVAQLVKNLLAMQETWVRFLGWEDTLEKKMATHSSTLAWRIPWIEEPGIGA